MEDLEETIKQIEEQVQTHAILLYMKGTPSQPYCGFSRQAANILIEIGKPFAYIDVLDNPKIRQAMPEYANWPTFPQLWIQGELVGGSDIVTDLHEKGELRKMVEVAANEAEG